MSRARYAVRIVRTGNTPQPAGSSARLELLDHEAKLGVKRRTDRPALYSSRIIKAAALLTDTKSYSPTRAFVCDTMRSVRQAAATLEAFRYNTMIG